MKMQLNVLKVIELLDGNYSNPRVRLNNFHLDKSKTNKDKFFRREPLIIINKNNGKWVIACCLGSPGIKGLTKDAIGLEYDSADMLGIKFHQECNLVIKKAPFLKRLQWYWSHPDQATQLAMQMSIIGTVFGTIAFIQSLF